MCWKSQHFQQEQHIGSHPPFEIGNEKNEEPADSFKFIGQAKIVWIYRETLTCYHSNSDLTKGSKKTDVILQNGLDSKLPQETGALPP